MGLLPLVHAAERVVNEAEGPAAVKIVRVYHGEGAVHHLAAAEDGVGRTPGPDPARRDLISRRQQPVEALEGVSRLHRPATVAYGRLEVLQHTGGDEEDHALKAGAHGVVY